MSTTTARLQLPYIAPQQAQKQVTYNAAMALLDRLVQPAVHSRTLAVPPAVPAEGDAYIVGPSATGDWAGREGRLATWVGGAWSFTAPAEGWLAYVIDATELAVFRAGAWESAVTSLARLGINTPADPANRLAVAADASLFTHAGAGHRLALNKAAAAETASLLFEDDFSARAEIGLTGDDALHLKVSPDGSSWLEALRVAGDTGVVGLPLGRMAFPATQNPSSDPNVLDDYAEGYWTPQLNFGNAATGITYGAWTYGRYTKIGRLVTIACMVTLTGKGSATGAAQIVGLPFPAITSEPIFASCAVGYATGFTGMTGAVQGVVQPSNPARINLYQSGNGAAANLTQANFTNTAALYLSCSYESN